MCVFYITKIRVESELIYILYETWIATNLTQLNCGKAILEKRKYDKMHETGSLSVSYTHLDVYKRQVLLSVAPFFSFRQNHVWLG